MTLTQATLAAAITSLILIGGSGPAFRSGAPLSAALGALAVGTVLGVLAAAAAFATLMAGLARGTPPSAVIIVALLLSLAAVYLPTRALWTGRTAPAIHDISTDLTDPPAFHAVLPLRGPDSNPVTFDPDAADEQLRAYPDIAPLTLAVSPEGAFTHALELARQSGWEIVAADQAAGRIEATAMTRWFGFKDDVVVRLTPTLGVGTRVDVRSVSRVGRGDLGANAARVREYLASLR